MVAGSPCTVTLPVCTAVKMVDFGDASALGSSVGLCMTPRCASRGGSLHQLASRSRAGKQRSGAEREASMTAHLSFPSAWMTGWKTGWDQPANTAARMGHDFGHNVLPVLIVALVVLFVATMTLRRT
jgi:hypothetical protein